LNCFFLVSPALAWPHPVANMPLSFFLVVPLPGRCLPPCVVGLSVLPSLRRGFVSNLSTPSFCASLKAFYGLFPFAVLYVRQAMFLGVKVFFVPLAPRSPSTSFHEPAAHCRLGTKPRLYSHFRFARSPFFWGHDSPATCRGCFAGDGLARRPLRKTYGPSLAFEFLTANTLQNEVPTAPVSRGVLFLPFFYPRFPAYRYSTPLQGFFPARPSGSLRTTHGPRACLRDVTASFCLEIRFAGPSRPGSPMVHYRESPDAFRRTFLQPRFYDPDLRSQRLTKSPLPFIPGPSRSDSPERLPLQNLVYFSPYGPFCGLRHRRSRIAMVRSSTSSLIFTFREIKRFPLLLVTLFCALGPLIGVSPPFHAPSHGWGLALFRLFPRHFSPTLPRIPECFFSRESLWFTSIAQNCCSVWLPFGRCATLFSPFP